MSSRSTHEATAVPEPRAKPVHPLVVPLNTLADAFGVRREIILEAAARREFPVRQVGNRHLVEVRHALAWFRRTFPLAALKFKLGRIKTDD
jgi:hypothetical protein